MTGKPVVLHVVEALGGGVMVAVRDYMSSTNDDFDHVLLANTRQGHNTGDLDGYALIPLGKLRNPIELVRKTRQTIRHLAPDIIHLHSSWAGLLGRICSPLGTSLVYTPHCYAFERRDISLFARTLFWVAEWTLAKRLTIVAAVSPREAELASRLNQRRTVTYVPNIALGGPGCRSESSASEVWNVVATGRVMSQKGPEWFASVARIVLASRTDFAFTWIGGGDRSGEKLLIDSGVTVTGWMSHRDVLGLLARADLYIHSAAWEGAPISALEAASYGIPCICRDIPAMRSLNFSLLADSPTAAAGLLLQVADSDDKSIFAEQSRQIMEQHTPGAQREILLGTYEVARDSFRNEEKAEWN
ncbi:MAG: glycosyltransferase [Actinobacteria bacterium]|nr:glycosyltransferase [Actinomycetota bacterium]